MEISLSFTINLQRQRVAVCRIAVSILLFTLLSPVLSYAQKEPEYYEISVSFNVQGIGITEMPAVIRDEMVYLPITDVFDFLKIKKQSFTRDLILCRVFLSTDKQLILLIEYTNVSDIKIKCLI